MEDLEFERVLEMAFTSKIEVPASFTNAIQSALAESNTKRFEQIKVTSLLRAVAVFIAICIVSTGIVYAGVSIYQYFQQVSKQDYSVAPGYDELLDKEYGIEWGEEKNLYYRKISTYEEYIKLKAVWSQLYEMNESDFEDYFVVMLSSQEDSEIRKAISDITVENDTLCIEIIESEEINEDKENTFFSIKLPKEYEREKIKISKVSVQPFSEKYIGITTIEDNYSIEKAIKDGCFVINNNKIISNDKEQLNEFLEKTKKEEESFIRIYLNTDNIQQVVDIQYNAGKYIIAIRDLRTSNNIGITYTVCNQIIKRNSDLGILIEGIFNKRTGTRICIIQ